MNIPLPTFVTIPTTAFLMGTNESDLSTLAKTYGGTRESYREESPQHRITLTSYAIATTPVTVALLATVPMMPPWFKTFVLKAVRSD